MVGPPSPDHPLAESVAEMTHRVQPGNPGHPGYQQRLG